MSFPKSTSRRFSTPLRAAVGYVCVGRRCRTSLYITNANSSKKEHNPT